VLAANRPDAERSPPRRTLGGVTARPRREVFIGGSNKAGVLRAVIEDYLRRSNVHIELDHGVDNMAMAVSLVASTAGLALMPSYAKGLLPRSIVSRPQQGKAPTIDVAVGYNRSNTSPILTFVPISARRTDGPEPRGLTGPGRPERNRNGLRGC
jgi:LysR family hca operon transcriptional activator